jgi:adenylate cyclase
MSVSLHIEITQDDGSVVQTPIQPGEYILGRSPDCDFVVGSPSVSRRHARICVTDTEVEVEDLGSQGGTHVDDQGIDGPVRLLIPATFFLTQLSVHIRFDSVPDAQPADFGGGASNAGGLICGTITGSDAKAPLISGISEQERRRLEMLYELPLQLAAEQSTDRLFRLILEKVISLIPGAVRGAILVKDYGTEKIRIRACIPADAPPISRSLIQRAANEQKGFIWGDEENDQNAMSASMVAIRIRTGMYVPLLWQDACIGVLFVDNPHSKKAFSEEDLRFLLSVANYAASAVANRLLQDDIEQNNRTLENLLTNFSPKIRSRLLEKSKEGRLQPGGEKSVVTILLSDLRGFTKTSSTLDSAVVVDMLNDYFRVLGHEVFRHDGTIDKFIGDAILAVFGSPEPDEHHVWKAVLAAIEMHRQMDAVNQRRRASNLPVCELGIGIFSGEVLHGFIGAEDRLEYTVIGDTVNKASRFCDGAKGGEILLGPLSYESVKDSLKAHFREITTKNGSVLPAYVVDWRDPGISPLE